MTVRANCAVSAGKAFAPWLSRGWGRGEGVSLWTGICLPPTPQLPASKIKRGILSISLASLLGWRRKWQPTPVLMPGKSHGRRSLVDYSPRGLEESDRTDQFHFHFSLFTFMCWRRKWQPTPVFLPGESQGRGRLVGCRLWGRTESDMTEAAAAALLNFE